MKTKPPTPPDGEQKISPLDDLLREMADLPSLDDLLAESKANDQAMFDEIVRQAQRDIDALLGPEERTVSKLLGAYTSKKPLRRCHRPRRRGKANHA